MNRADYIKELESKLSKLSPEEKFEAVSYYEEIFDDREIGDFDEVPDDMPNPRKASYEILRNINIDKLEMEEKHEKSKASLFGTIVLWIMAMPIALPLAIVLLAVIFGLIITIFTAGFGFLVAGIVAACATIYEIFTLKAEPLKVVYLVGVVCVSIAVSIFAVYGVKGFIKFVKTSLVNYRNKRR